MNQYLRRFIILIGGALSCTAGNLSAESGGASSEAIPVHFVEPSVAPEFGVPAEAQKAVPDPGSGPDDGGPLSKLLHGKVFGIAVSYYDHNAFQSPRKTEDFLHLLLSADTGHTWNFQIWSQPLGKPSIATQLKFKDGSTGKFLVWVYPPPDHPQLIQVVCQDEAGKWRYAAWQETDKNSLIKQLRQQNLP
jgi:hypothetical protein